MSSSCPVLPCPFLSLLQRLKVTSPVNQANAAAVVTNNGSGNINIAPREGVDEKKEAEPSAATPIANRLVADVYAVQSAEAVPFVSAEDAGVVEAAVPEEEREEEKACVEGTATGEQQRDKAMDPREKEPLQSVDEGGYFDADGFPQNGPGRRSGGKRSFRDGTG